MPTLPHICSSMKANASCRNTIQQKLWLTYYLRVNASGHILIGNACQNPLEGLHRVEDGIVEVGIRSVAEVTANACGGIRMYPK